MRKRDGRKKRNAIRFGVFFGRKHEIRGTRCFLLSPPATLLEAVLHIVEREREWEGERKILRVPWKPISDQEKFLQLVLLVVVVVVVMVKGSTRIFEITSRQTTSVSLLGKTYMKFEQSRSLRYLNFFRSWNWNPRKVLERLILILIRDKNCRVF